MHQRVRVHVHGLPLLHTQPSNQEKQEGKHKTHTAALNQGWGVKRHKWLLLCMFMH